MNPMLTLEAIRVCDPCPGGWAKGLKAFGPVKAGLQFSLGDIALSNDVKDAFWSIRALDWSDIAIRRAVIGGIVLPAVRRASKHTTDKRVLECIEAVAKWCDGDDTVDLMAAQKATYATYATYAAAYAAAAHASHAAAYAYAAHAAADAADAADAAATAYATTNAHAAAHAAHAPRAADAAADAADAEERGLQLQDILRVFPPVRLSRATAVSA